MKECYAELFERFLHDRIAAGGDVDRICVLAVAFLRHDLAVRRAVFDEWRAGERFHCVECGTEFSGRTTEADESDRIRCTWCVNGYRLGEPVPGYRRTFARG